MANLSRMRAFLKVGKQPASDLDFEGLLPPIERREESVANAEASLTLPNDQMHYAQFWFINSTPLDIVAFNHLKGGGTAEAKGIWQKRNCASSLQNRIVLALIQKNWVEALSCCEALYGDKDLAESLFYSVTGEEGMADADEMAFYFIDTLADEVGADTIIRRISNTKWRHHLGGKASKPVSDAIARLISSAEDANGAYAALRAANRLRNEAGVQLSELKSLLGSEDPEFRMMADKLADTIIRCCIEYYNKTDDYGSIRQLKGLMEYALSIAEGQFEKNRCQENMAILQEKIDELPPEEIENSVKIIRDEIAKLNSHKGDISEADSFLNRVKPHLTAIRKVVGIYDNLYVKLSTMAVRAAQNCVVDCVNGKMSNINEKIMLLASPDYHSALLEEALRVFDKMKKFDMEASFRQNIFQKNEATLKSLQRKLLRDKESLELIQQLETAQRTPKKPMIPYWVLYLIFFAFMMFAIESKSWVPIIIAGILGIILWAYPKN
ncbi:MAG: hypothetical protein ACI35Q_06085 [Marinilabiliaceae bacterium]